LFILPVTATLKRTSKVCTKGKKFKITEANTLTDDTSIDIPENHTKQEKQVPKEVQMVSNTCLEQD